MAKPKLVLYVDVVSPFAYLAFHVLNVCRFLCFQMMIAESSQGVIPSFVTYVATLFDMTVSTALYCYFSDPDDYLRDEYESFGFAIVQMITDFTI